MHEMYVLRTTRNRFCPWAIKFTSRDLFHLLLGIIYCYSLSRILITLSYFYIYGSIAKCVKIKLCFVWFFFHFTNNGQMVCLKFPKNNVGNKRELLWGKLSYYYGPLMYTQYVILHNGWFNLSTLLFNHQLYYLYDSTYTSA